MRGHGRVSQDVDLEIEEVRGRSVERLLGLVAASDADDRPIVVELKPEGLPWQRFFLDAGLAFWESVDAPDGTDDRTRLVDYGARHGFEGAVIASATCHGSGPEGLAAISIAFDSGATLVLHLQDEADMDSISVLTVEREPRARHRRSPASRP